LTGITKFGLLLIIMQNFTVLGRRSSEISLWKKVFKNVRSNVSPLLKTIVSGRTKQWTFAHHFSEPSGSQSRRAWAKWWSAIKKSAGGLTFHKPQMLWL